MNIPILLCLAASAAMRSPSQLPPSRVDGIGLNVHAELLPVDRLKQIGIKWIRMDLDEKHWTDEWGHRLLTHYKDFGILFLVAQDWERMATQAKKLVDWGVTDIEVMNEPIFWKPRISPEEYAAKFASIRQAVGGRARLYGPAQGVHDPDEKRFWEASLRAGLMPDVVTIHWYAGVAPERAKAYLDDAGEYGFPVIISETGFPQVLDGRPFRLKIGGSVGSMFLRMKRALVGETWCFYDGPNDTDPARDSGLFDRNSVTGEYQPSKAFYEIARGG